MPRASPGQDGQFGHRVGRRNAIADVRDLADNAQRIMRMPAQDVCRHGEKKLMAFERGGYADKRGNQYEDRWVVKQLLRVLNEEILSVTVEPVGEDERGVDLWVTRCDGTRQAQQCKARNPRKSR